MSQLVRNIEHKDLPIIKTLLKKVFNDESYSDIQRLNGMTNRSYKITRLDKDKNKTEYLVRIPGEGTETLINRFDERKSTELACKLGIDSELLYFGDDGAKVMKFISNPKFMSDEVMRRDENISRAASIFRKLHTCGVDTGVKFEVFEMADKYEAIIKNNGVKLYDDYEDIRKTVMNIKSDIDKSGKALKVPCHNDSLIGNWVLASVTGGGGGM